MPDAAKQGQTAAPAGTGNAPGLGEAFSINLSTGQGMYSLKLPLPEGIAGQTPRLSLEYAHGQGHSAFGFGWRVPLRTISRRLDFGVPSEGGTQLAASERFMDSGAELLRLNDGTYHTQVETAFSVYTRVGDGWKIEDRNGVAHDLGMTSGARLAEPGQPSRLHEWLLERTTDPSGNAIDYSYELHENRLYLALIRYASYAVRFEYEQRADVRTDARLGFLRKLDRRCVRILVVLNPGPGERLIRSWTLAYQMEPWSGISLLSSARLISHGGAPDGSQDVRRQPISFGYTPFDPSARQIYWMRVQDDGPEPPPLTDSDVALLNMDQSPLPGVLHVRNGKQYYWRNRGDGTWGYPTPVVRTPNVRSFAHEGLAFVDMDSSGNADLLVAADDKLPGYYENGGTEGWTRFVAFPRGQRTSPDWRARSLRLLDADGDGRIDAIASQGRSFAVWLNQGERGWSEPLLAPRANDVPDLDDPSVHLADMTGDGLLDIVRVRSGRIEYWPGLGRGRFGAQVVMTGSPRLRDLTRNPQSLIFADINGDGCADLIRLSATGVEVFLNQNGTAFTAPINIPDVPAPISGTLRPINLSGHFGTGLVWNSSRGLRTGYVGFEFTRTVPQALTRIDNGAGLVSEIHYRSAVEDYERDHAAGEFWHTHFPFPYLVVAGTSETDSVTGRHTEVEFRYHEAHFATRERQFQGFRSSERIEKGDVSRSDTITVSHFLMGQERLPGNGPEHAALNGMLRRTEVFGLDGSSNQNKPFRVEESDYALQTLEVLPDGRQRVFLSVTATRTFDSERTADSRNEEKRFNYDAFGNVTRERHRAFGTRAGVAQLERVRVTEIAYAQSSTRWMIDRVSSVVVRDESNRLLSEIRRYYDGPEFTGLPFGQATRGLLTREEQLVLSRPEFDAHYAGMNAADLGYLNANDADGVPAVFAQASRFAYDTRGLKIASKDEVGNLISYQYDAPGLFRTRLTDSFGVTAFDNDPAIGQPLRITYADGTQANFAYDAQGRVIATALPGETLANPPRSYEYSDAVVPNSRTARFRFAAGATDIARVVTYFDGTGKEIQQRVETRDQKFVVSGWQELNAWGDPRTEFESSIANDAAFAVPNPVGRPQREFFYDARGRAVRTVNYNRGVSTASYLPFEVITRDANDNDNSPENVARGQFNTPHREQFDVLRYLTAVIEDLGNGNSSVTTFQTGSGGEILQTADAHGRICAYQYDRRGNRLQIQHRDAGTRLLWYDARKLIVRTLDQRGNDMRATLDARGRVTQLTADGVTIEQYSYDVAAQNALGRLAAAIYTGGSQKFFYNATGSLLTHKYQFEGVAAQHTLTYEYDLLGREVAVTHPDGTRIAKTLTPNGWVQAIAGFIDKVEYDARGLTTQINYHNGVTTDFTYTSGPGREKTRITRNTLNQVLEDVSYEFDRLEILLNSNDSGPGGTGRRGYSYDPLYQIKGLTSIENGAPVEHQYTYSGTYNLTRFDEGGSTMQYDDAAHPDRVAGITPNGGARVNAVYDANGNLLNLPGRTFTYNAKNEVVRLDTASGIHADYRYDHEGRRVSKTVTDGPGPALLTLFVGDVAEIRAGQPAYFVRLANQRIAIVFNGTTRFAHNDYLGNSNFFTDAAGTKIGTIVYRPFGNVASTIGTVDFQTFGAHPFDAESGLIYMKRRYYAPELGRFLNPDPLAIYQPEKFLNNPKGLHLYIYVANDPLNKTDPTGLSFWSFLGGVFGVLVGVLVAAAVIALTVMTFGAFGIVAAIFVGLGLTVVAFGLMAVAYVIASATAGTAFGDFMRGFLIGFNAGMNAAIATALFGPVVGIALGVVNFLAVFDGIANNSIYQGILGWASWFMPMSWLATAVGLFIFVVNVVVAFVTVTIPGWFGGSGWAAARIDSVSIDWGTGTIVMAGGLISPAANVGFNVGNFVYLASGSGGDAALIAHETGHTLNVAAFGSLFHFVGALDENWPGNRGENAYAEKLAESHANRAPRPTVPLWG